MKLRYYIFGTICAIMLILTITIPIGTDVAVSFGSAMQADYLGKFPFNVYDSWNLRGIGYKYFIYLIYKTGLIFSNPDNQSFQVWVKIIYYAILIPLSLLSFNLLKPIFEKLKVYWVDAFIIFLISALSLSWNYPMQPEDICIYLTVAMIAFALSPHKKLNYLSGIFIPLLISLKIVTISFAVFPTIILFYAWKTERQLLKRYLISCTGFLILTAVIYLFIIPREIKDTYQATLFQTSFHLSIKSLFNLGLWFMKSFSNSAYLLVGSICIVILIFKYSANLRNRLFIVFLFAIPALVVLIQNRFSGYQYLVFFPASMIVISLFMSTSENTKTYLMRLGAIVATITTIWVSCIVMNPKIPIKDSSSSYSWYLNTIYNSQKKAFNEINEKYHLSDQKTMLFLTGGYPNFFIHCKSYLRYFYPLPLKRVTENPKLKGTLLYKETLEESLAYKDDYILLEPNWFDLNNTLPLKQKIETEYDLVYQKSFPGYHDGDLSLYKRKNVGNLFHP